MAEYVKVGTFKTAGMTEAEVGHMGRNVVIAGLTATGRKGGERGLVVPPEARGDFFRQLAEADAASRAWERRDGVPAVTAEPAAAVLPAACPPSAGGCLPAAVAVTPSGERILLPPGTTVLVGPNEVISRG